LWFKDGWLNEAFGGKFRIKLSLIIIVTIIGASIFIFHYLKRRVNNDLPLQSNLLITDKQGIEIDYCLNAEVSG